MGYPGEDVDFQMADDLFRIVLRPLTVFLGASVLGTSQPFDGVELRNARLFFLTFSDFLRVLAIGAQAVCFVCLGARLSQCYRRIRTHVELGSPNLRLG